MAKLLYSFEVKIPLVGIFIETKAQDFRLGVDILLNILLLGENK